MKKHWRYLLYILRHKFFVLVAGAKVGTSWWRLLVHDWSKLLPCEWRPYAEYFYGHRLELKFSNEAERAFPGILNLLEIMKRDRQDRFDRAWLHHQKLNPHHWQYWILREDSGATKLLPMPEKYIREMVADWMGAGRAITGNWEASAWYVRNRDRIQLADQTRARVEVLLGIGSQE
jgi:hypothetical protein